MIAGVRSQFGRQFVRDRRTVGEQLDAGRDHDPAGGDLGTVVEGQPESVRGCCHLPHQAPVDVRRDLLLHPRAVVDEAVQRHRPAEAGTRGGAERVQGQVARGFARCR